MAEGRQARPLRSYGRRKGHKLSPRQERLLADVLPRIKLDLAAPAPQALRLLFRAPVRETWLEIGFGAGEHLVAQATAHPDVGLIGVEPFLNGIVKALDAVATRGLASIRLHDGDARDLLAWLPPASIARAFILFPDPWPKARHRKRRLVNRETLAALARVLAPGAELRLASDIQSYVAQMLCLTCGDGRFAWLADRPADWRARPPGWPPTRYEKKALAAGRTCTYLRFVRRVTSMPARPP